ncbi:MAG: DNA adenine methylase [Ruminococcus sp.]|nr:DNA adenine methylase [Ruminococcus sp.]MCM1381846.1 DNA adenine methylase [Muribaculaceae bacterium]MCM1478853.1 DNA adenine methylase [Muribaculaceae bacterium]
MRSNWKKALNNTKNDRKIISGVVTYCGGKKRVLEDLDEFFDAYDADIFIDLCGGSGIVTANRIAGRRIINDANAELAVIYKALSCDEYSYPMADIMQELECDKETYQKAWEYLEDRKEWNLQEYIDDDLPTAAAYSWFVRFFSRIGSRRDEKSSFIESKLKKWYNLVDGEEICSYMDAFENVEVWNMDMFDALRKIKSEITDECVIYIDPPYLSDKNSDIETAQKTYDYSLDENGHAALLKEANKLPKEKYHIIISGYENECYDALLEKPEFQYWEKIFLKEIDIMCGDGSNCSYREQANEYIYTNSG